MVPDVISCWGITVRGGIDGSPVIKGEGLWTEVAVGINGVQGLPPTGSMDLFRTYRILSLFVMFYTWFKMPKRVLPAELQQ